VNGYFHIRTVSGTAGRSRRRDGYR